MGLVVCRTAQKIRDVPNSNASGADLPARRGFSHMNGVESVWNGVCACERRKKRDKLAAQPPKVQERKMDKTVFAAVDLYTPTYLETIYTAHESVALSLKETALNFHALYICSRVGDQ